MDWDPKLYFSITHLLLSLSLMPSLPSSLSPFKSQQSDFTLPLINCPLLPFSFSILSSSYSSHSLASLLTDSLLSPPVIIIPTPFMTFTTFCLLVLTVIGCQGSQSKELVLSKGLGLITPPPPKKRNNGPSKNCLSSLYVLLPSCIRRT